MKKTQTWQEQKQKIKKEQRRNICRRDKQIKNNKNINVIIKINRETKQGRNSISWKQKVREGQDIKKKNNNGNNGWTKEMKKNAMQKKEMKRSKKKKIKKGQNEWNKREREKDRSNAKKE